ncbi:NAD(P)-dependent oxidoreductase [Streptomyces pseudovenezuelae]|uniref:3-hydroxyisobutyrate dehydrogenase-like beta-hydroxyacid dehydrogenase n=1 Tax=Streptomyces pseudovenezuelae TaxID=67350 RepID=A0ABT6M1I4_9ACTN|nr:NAD(P)-dependent oxidoreductase [Streptomyces pseudovenezuelae]MDH6222405.1 3-hydroxyisobutyrate dehydrogenase-like beta-hydroxyacid dehydrogenase [Streptomyces pseudovenezuelae]
MTTTVTLLHPGSMGAPVGARVRRAGARVLYVPAGRGPASIERAREAGLEAAESLEAALAVSDLVLSICPPHAAENVAHEVLGHAFRGIYMDANAISPERTLRIAAACHQRGIVMVDGSIIGAPPGGNGSPRLYLSGDAEAADRVASLFKGTEVLARPLDAGVGAASALKMSFASFQKSARALAAVSHALATSHGVGAELALEAESVTSKILAEVDQLPSVAARAWRWAPEMEEIATTLRSTGLPPDLAEASATVMRHWTADKDRFDLPLEDVLAHLHGHDDLKG